MGVIRLRPRPRAVAADVARWARQFLAASWPSAAVGRLFDLDEDGLAELLEHHPAGAAA